LAAPLKFGALAFSVGPRDTHDLADTLGKVINPAAWIFDVPDQ
jgi:hypothetical protein